MDKELTPYQAKALEVLENRRFWTLLGVFALILLAGGFSRYYLQEKGKNQERAASDKLFSIEKLEVEGLAPNQNIFSADFMKKRLEWPADKKANIKKQLQELVAEYPKSASAQSGRIRLAAMAYQESQFDESIKHFDDVILNGTKDITNVPYWTALLGKGYALETQKKLEDSLKSYREVSADIKNPLAAEALLSEVRVLKALGKTDEMTAVLTKIKVEFADSYYESAARAYENAR